VQYDTILKTGISAPDPGSVQEPVVLEDLIGESATTTNEGLMIEDSSGDVAE
jgi:hypothetical protein